MKLLLSIGIFLIALVGTIAGNLIMLVLGDPKGRSKALNPDTGELTITGVLTNGIIATLIALLVGMRRLRCAFLNGLALTVLLGDRLDRELLGSKPPEIKLSTQKEVPPDPNAVPAAVAGHRNGPSTP